MITDEMLRRAAAESLDGFMKNVESGYDPERAFTPSPQFERKIARLARRAKRPFAYRTLHRAASLLLAAVLGGVVWLSVDSPARAAFAAWAREAYEGSVVYAFFGRRDSRAMPEFAFASPPEGFTESDFIAQKNMCLRIYENNDQVILLSYMIMSEESAKSVLSSGYYCESVRIGKLFGEFYKAENSDESNELIWFDEKKQIVFQISAFLEKDEMLALAEKIIIK